MAGTVNHRQESRVLEEFFQWVMDGEPLTTEEERQQYDGYVLDDGVEDEPEMETSRCMQCEQPFAQPKDAKRRRVFCQGCR